MNEGPVPRPENVSPEQWNALGREEQVDWWCEFGSPRYMREIVLYEAEFTTKLEAANAIFKRIDSDSIQDVLLRTPPEVLEVIRKSVASFPADDDDQAWRNLPIYHMCCVWDASVTEKDLEELDRQTRIDTRKKARIFRAADGRRVVDL